MGKHSDFIEYALGYEGDDCLIWPFALQQTGYGAYRGRDRDGRIVQRNAHRQVLIERDGPSPLYVLHSCRERRCVNPAHLRWGTNAENMADKVADGTHNRGTRHGASRYTEDDIRRVRSTSGTKAELMIVAEELGMHWNYADLIYRRKRWAWLD